MSEKLSALVDNELEEFERARILRELGRDESLTERWSRYHIIGLAMRREVINPSQSIVEGLAERLAREAIPGARVRNGGPRATWRRSATGYAVAASAAAVLLLGGLVVKLYDDSQTGAPAAPETQQIAGLDDATHWDSSNPQVQDALNTLLMEHGEFTPASGMNGLTAYTKFVAYDGQ